MNEIVEKENVIVEDMIYEVSGKQVMIDRDLAKLYGCKNGTKEINQAVKNNIEKFPERYSWILTDKELDDLRSKKLTTNISNKSRSMPRVFTEQGVAMLATILKSKIAAEISIKIMDAFVAMRHFINDNKNIYITLNNINNKLIEHDEKINYLFSKFDRKEKLFLPGEEYDAYSNIIDIFKEAKNELIIIDNYADKTILDIIKDIKCNVTIITKGNSLLNKQTINKYNRQYHNLNIIYSSLFHDRYIILDRKEIYHCGASINYAGSKLFSLNKLEDKIIIDTLIKYISNIENKF